MASRLWGALFAAALLATGSASEAMADKRVALVIGNSAYRHAPTLPNPANDATGVSILLKSAGFDLVQTRHDLGTMEMRRAVRDFADAARDADMAVVFFAGHGIEVDGNNFLIPIDAKLERDIDVEDETVSLERILKVVEPAKRLRLVILDACRDNPFARTMKRVIARRALGRGLASVEPATSDTLIAFAAKAGSTAADGTGTHSPFTAALLKHIATPGLDLRIAFGRVRDEVLNKTGNRQEPFVYGSLGGANVTLVSAATGGKIEVLSDDPNARAARDYDLAANVGTKEAWDAFLLKYPAGFYAELARAQRAKVTAALSMAVPTFDPPLAPKAGAKVPRPSKRVAPIRTEQPAKKKLKTAASRYNLTPEYCRQYYPNGANPRWLSKIPSAVGRETWKAVIRACGAGTGP